MANNGDLVDQNGNVYEPAGGGYQPKEGYFGGPVTDNSKTEDSPSDYAIDGTRLYKPKPPDTQPGSGGGGGGGGGDGCSTTFQTIVASLIMVILFSPIAAPIIIIIAGNNKLKGKNNEKWELAKGVASILAFLSVLILAYLTSKFIGEGYDRFIPYLWAQKNHNLVLILGGLFRLILFVLTVVSGFSPTILAYLFQKRKQFKAESDFDNAAIAKTQFILMLLFGGSATFLLAGSVVTYVIISFLST